MSPKPARRKAKSVEKTPYHRRVGVIRRSGLLGSRPGDAITGSPDVIDGGEDARLTAHGRAIFRYALLGIFVVFVVLALATAAGH